jgi:cell division protein FtsB
LDQLKKLFAVIEEENHSLHKKIKILEIEIHGLRNQLPAKDEILKQAKEQFI